MNNGTRVRGKFKMAASSRRYLRVPDNVKESHHCGMSDQEPTAVKSPVDTTKARNHTTKGGYKTPARSSSGKQSAISSSFVSPLLKRPFNHDSKDCERKKRFKQESKCTCNVQELNDDENRSADNHNDCRNQLNSSLNVLETEERVSMKSVQINKKELIDKVRQKEETIRKLKMVKTYRKKNNLEQLQELIQKWRSVSQEAAERLLAKLPDPKPNMSELLNCLQIDHELIRYSTEDESFY